MSTPRVRATGLLACALLAGCAPHGQRVPTPTGTAGDWRNATYTVTCDGVIPGGFRATLHDGAAKVPAEISDTPSYTDFDVDLEATATGDVDGTASPTPSSFCSATRSRPTG